MSQSRIQIHQLHFNLPNGTALFSDLSLSFSSVKTGLVGRNGIGKSTLIKLIANELSPSSGSIKIAGVFAYVPQNPSFSAGQTIADLLGFSQKLNAFQKIKQGSLDENDYAIFSDDWDIEERLQKQLALLGLDYLPYTRQLNQLSGGEITRLLLTKAFFSNAKFLLLDEPTNHLDSMARKQLYAAIEQWQGSLIVVSHDRKLLNLMEEIVELSSLGAACYGGNYDFYAQQKMIEKNAAENLLQAHNEILANAKEIAQQRRERHEQNEAKGNRAKKAQIKAKGSYDKLAFKSAKGRSERTNRRIRLQADRKLTLIETQLQAAKDKIEITDEIHVSLPATQVPQGKIILEIEDLTFSYPDAKKPIIENFNLKLSGPARVALSGANGSGKTTLVNLIMNAHGNIYLGTDRIKYLDQNSNLLHSQNTVLDNYMRLNPDATENDAYASLAQFLFKNTAAQKRVIDLSGGEKLRALLACILKSKQPPQLLILDEPTNHLDLDSVKKIEAVLKNYQGAMIVISHDQVFLDNLGVDTVIFLSIN